MGTLRSGTEHLTATKEFPINFPALAHVHLYLPYSTLELSLFQFLLKLYLLETSSLDC